MEKTQKLNLTSSYDVSTRWLIWLGLGCGAVFALLIHLASLMGNFIPTSLIVIPSAILVSTVAIGFVFYPRFAKKPMPASIEYDLVNKKILIHHSNAKLFPPKIIRFDEIEEINYSCIGTYKGCVTVAIDFKTFDNRNFSLRSFGYNGSHVKFIAPLEALKEQEGFKTELKNFPTQFFSWIEKYKREGKLSLFLEMGF